MKLINLTPHRITIYPPAGWTMLGNDDSPIVVEPSGTVARCAETREIVSTVPQPQGSFEIPVFCVAYGEVGGLPEPAADTAYIVSMRLAQAVPNRADVYFPGEAVRDAAGNIIGCVGLSKL